MQHSRALDLQTLLHYIPQSFISEKIPQKNAMDSATTQVTPDNTDPTTAEVDRASELGFLKPYVTTARVRMINAIVRSEED